MEFSCNNSSSFFVYCCICVCLTFSYVQWCLPFVLDLVVCVTLTQALVPVTEEVPVAIDLHRFIIGSKGRDVRQLMEEFEVLIQVPPTDENISVLRVTRSPENVGRATLCCSGSNSSRTRRSRGYVCVARRCHPNIGL